MISSRNCEGTKSVDDDGSSELSRLAEGRGGGACIDPPRAFLWHFKIIPVVVKPASLSFLISVGDTPTVAS